MTSGPEPPWMSVAAYAVHTRSCTYVLDRAGVCHWVLAPNGGPATSMDRCIGAQFVACIDPSEPALLVGELRLGATALFACHDGVRFVLLRSPTIEWVEERAPSGAPPRAEFGETTERLTGMGEPTLPARGPLPPARPPPHPSSPSVAENLPSAAYELISDPSLRVDEIVSYSEVTLTMPLYRADTQTEPPPTYRHALARGERLR